MRYQTGYRLPAPTGPGSGGTGWKNRRGAWLVLSFVVCVA
jgi:hypothetical protein